MVLVGELVKHFLDLVEVGGSIDAEYVVRVCRLRGRREILPKFREVKASKSKALLAD